MFRSIYSFTDPLPPTLYWDASFIVNFALATMHHHGIRSIVTMDSDFLPVSDLDIYTCVPAILQQADAP